MKYFIDTEFHEGFHKPLFGRKRHFIDLISIGIISDDGREYYAINKDFDMKAAWNSYQLEMVSGDQRNIFPEGKKVYWLRNNVLRLIFDELIQRWASFEDKANQLRTSTGYNPPITFNLKNLKNVIDKFGKSNKRIANEILKFVNSEPVSSYGTIGGTAFITEQAKKIVKQGFVEPEFYGYYCDYDWVVFCSLFGKMIDLPKGFPMYCIDLKQMFDEDYPKQTRERVKGHPDYPKQTNEHNALADAKWNKELYEFLNNL